MYRFNTISTKTPAGFFLLDTDKIMIKLVKGKRIRKTKVGTIGLPHFITFCSYDS